MKLRLTKANRPFMAIDLNDTLELNRLLGEFLNDQSYMDFIGEEIFNRIGEEDDMKVYQAAESVITDEMMSGFYFYGKHQEEPRTTAESYPELEGSEEAKKLFFFVTSIGGDYDCKVED